MPLVAVQDFGGGNLVEQASAAVESAASPTADAKA
jgi:hypothetical protein